MRIDFLTTGPLSYVLPAALVVLAIFTLGNLLRGKYAPGLAVLVAGGLCVLGASFLMGQRDTQTLDTAISQRYGLALSDSQLGTLRENHSYRRYQADRTVETSQGAAKPYGTITTSVAGKAQRVMLYEAHGLWHLGAVPAGGDSAKMPELPANIPVVN